MLILITGAVGAANPNMRKKSAVDLRAVQKNIILQPCSPTVQRVHKRTRRHHALRQGKGFETIEQYQNVSKAFDKVQTEVVSHAAQNEKPVVLLECLSNLMANECFEEGGTPDAVFSDCIQLYRQCRHLVIVTNEIFSDGCLYDNTTTDYITRLGRLNTQLVQEADCVAEVVYSIPVYWKGSYELIQENLPL